MLFVHPSITDSRLFSVFKVEMGRIAYDGRKMLNMVLEKMDLIPFQLRSWKIDNYISYAMVLFTNIVCLQLSTILHKSNDRFSLQL